jgi:hypothetical protein
MFVARLEYEKWKSEKIFRLTMFFLSLRKKTRQLKMLILSKSINLFEFEYKLKKNFVKFCQFTKRTLLAMMWFNVKVLFVIFAIIGVGFATMGSELEEDNFRKLKESNEGLENDGIDEKLEDGFEDSKILLGSKKLCENSIKFDKGKN